MAQAISNSLNDPTSMPAPAAAVPPTPLTTGAAVGRTTGGGAADLSAREAAAAAAMARAATRCSPPAVRLKTLAERLAEVAVEEELTEAEVEAAMK